MFNKFLTIAFIIVTIFICVNINQAQIVEKGLVSYWSFNNIEDETVKDEWGNNDGTFEGPEKVEGKYGNALTFDGQDDYVNCGNDESLNITDEISIMAWVYMESEGSYPTVVAKSGANWGYIFEFLTTTRRINLYLDQANPSWDNVAETAAELKEWTHLAATFDGEAIQYYFNGNPDGIYSNIPGGSIASNQDNVHIGGRKVGEPHNFEGIIDEVCIYNRTLDESEIKRNMKSDGTAVSLCGKLTLTWADIKK